MLRKLSFFRTSLTAASKFEVVDNGLLHAFHADPQDFNSNLLIGLPNNGRVNNLSFNFSKGGYFHRFEGSALSLNFPNNLPKVELVFTVKVRNKSINQCFTEQVAVEILKDFHESVFGLYEYCLSRKNTQEFDPKPLLIAIADCVTIRGAVLEFNSISKIETPPFSSFIELLTCKFIEVKKNLCNLELNRPLDEGTKKRP